VRLKPHDRILAALRANAGAMSRAQIWQATGRNFSAERLTKLLETYLAGLVIEEETPVKNYRWRTQKRWRLTEWGWQASGGIPSKESSQIVNAEVVAVLLNRLAAKGDKWAIAVQEARQAWQNRSRVAPTPTSDTVKDILWRMVDGPKSDFAKHYLKLMDSPKFRDWERTERLRKKVRRRKRPRRPLTQQDIERINRARERNGEEPLRLRGSSRKPTEARPSQAKPELPVLEPEPVSEPVEQAAPAVYIYHDGLLDWYFYDGQRVHKSREEIEKVKNVRIVEISSGYRRNGIMRTTEGIEWDSRVSPVPMPKSSHVASEKPPERPKSTHRDASPSPAYVDRNPVPITPNHGAQSASDLLAKIQEAGFRTNIRGDVLYDFQWIPASDWVKRMGWASDGPQ
jgi:hypothetical protein